ncbi:hypothetical protein ASE82_00320 [Sphingomonas sp. Leaf230]|uniref:hypothetical protein n=1 Tax=Sphingomonas sp. Leaf230 TaxID=1735694 RepID=UPI0006FA21C3|nr:hypothetical protein [Sphingomonas sp. Leaf230]KQN05473.1 hypothetical protein ASE82_00320 [Sphingomonas sp. Leaf230]
MIITTLIQTVSAMLPTAPPAPPALPAPPIMTSNIVERGFGGATAAERYVVDVDGRADGAVVWTGSLRVASNAAASFRRDQTEAEENDCGVRAGYRSGVQTGFSLQLRPTRVDEADSGVAVMLRWTRPGTGQCPVQASTRTVEMNDAVRLKAGETVTMKGDGGLVVKLHRRP